MIWLFLIIIIILLIPTAYAGYIGAPYVPTRRKALEKTFDVLLLNAADVVVDLGCGDGGVLRAAARRGATVIGYELSPVMWVIAWTRLFFARYTNPPLTPPLSPLRPWASRGEAGRAGLPDEALAKSGRVFLRNFYTQQLPSETTIIFFFLMPKNLPRLLAYLRKQNLPRAKYALSYTFALPGIAPARVITTKAHGTIYVYNWEQLR